MKLLLDTCAFIWMLEEPERLSARIRATVAEAQTQLLLSAVSVWEIGVKSLLGNLDFPQPLDVSIPRTMKQFSLAELPMDVASAVLSATLPPLHKDPFDRMLICQAKQHGLTIVTPDEHIQQYGVPCLW